jgi:hypothetical protein
MNKHLNQREIDHVNKDVWETLKHTTIVHELLQDEQLNVYFYTPFESFQ